ncbi:hypothetical protein [Ktedonobacter sp. SOSP1-85]|uniref:hypothetical protein n=1 Tax=Ktedonobacter sp. SOSP1-85 TaxID=2778367 RepID=UPI0019165C07|nr:hypothetical protein [Ktedonobacter sp. SOSP1-85]
MNFMTIMAQNLFLSVALMIFMITMVSIVFGILLEVYKVNLRARQRMQELRNEELHLQLQLEQQRGTSRGKPSRDDLPHPKETASWDEQPQSNYEMGYQAPMQSL